MCSARATRSTFPSLAAALLGGLAVGLGGSASAATKSGPLLGLGAELRYDSDALAGGGEELMTKLSPRLGWRARSERRLFEAGYALDAIGHLNGGGFTVDHRGGLKLRERLSRRLRLDADLSAWRVEDTASLPRFGVAATRTGALWGLGELTASLQASRRATLTAGWRAEATRLLRPGERLGAVQAFSTRAAGLLTRRLELGLGLRYQFFSAGLEQVAGTYSASLSTRWRVARHAFLFAEAGPLLYRSTEADTLDLRLKAGLEYAARGLEAGVTVGRDYVGAAGYAVALWADYLQSAVSYRASEPLRLYGAAGLFRNGLAPARPTAALGYTLSVGTEWRFGNGLTAGLGLDRVGQIGLEDPGLTMARNIAGLRLGWRRE